jgi:EamA-like transporter family
MPDPTTSEYARGAFYGLAAVCIWAGFIVVSRLGVRTSLTPWDVAAIRFTVAGTLLLPCAMRKGLALDRLGWLGVAAIVIGTERSLYERANGYNYDAVKIFMPAGAKQPVIVHYIEHCPPDVGAAFIWLKNRDPEHWRDVQNVEHAIGKYIISDRPMTEQEWARERATVIDEKVVEEPPKLGEDDWHKRIGQER